MRMWIIVAVATVMLAVAAGGYFLYTRRAHAFSETDTVVLADFVNTTGDPVFSGTLQQALAVSLRQSPYISIVPDSRIQSTLRLMGRANDGRLSTDVARDLAQRVRAKAVIVGSIAQLGNAYVITLGAVNAATGDTIAQDQLQSNSKEAVLATVGQATAHLRRKLGESLSSIARLDKPLQEATTPSLEALRDYTLGEEQRQKSGDTLALPYYRRAVELDPNFALAYARLGTIYANLGDTRLSEENTRKAFELKDRVSEYEKLYITSHYYEFVTLEDDKAMEVYELWAKTYPRDFTPVLNTAVLYSNTGQFEKALEKAQQALQLDPDHVLAYENVVAFFCSLARYDEAEAILAQAAGRKLEDGSFHFFKYYIAFGRGNAKGMKAELDWARGKPIESMMIAADASTAAYFGQLSRARSLYRKSAELAATQGHRESAAEALVNLGTADALFGDVAGARQAAADALQLDSGGRVAGQAAILMAMSGDRLRAEKLAKQCQDQYPNATVLNYMVLPLIRSWIISDPAAVVGELEPARLYERAAPLVLYRRGNAYLRAGSGVEARDQFEKMLATGEVKGIAGPEKGLARLGLARAYALVGDQAKARTAYQDFLALWKNADPGIPILEQAKAEYAKAKIQ